jgi:hypothetical protein
MVGLGGTCPPKNLGSLWFVKYAIPGLFVQPPGFLCGTASLCKAGQGNRSAKLERAELMEEKVVNAVALGLCGYVAATVLSFFAVLFIGQLISEPDGLSQEFARLPAIVYAPFLGIIGLVVGCVIGAKRTGRPK